MNFKRNSVFSVSSCEKGTSEEEVTSVEGRGEKIFHSTLHTRPLFLSTPDPRLPLLPPVKKKANEESE